MRWRLCRRQSSGGDQRRPGAQSNHPIKGALRSQSGSGSPLVGGPAPPEAGLSERFDADRGSTIVSAELV